ncbi:MAG: carboxymuconolactone decarboxylase family protein [Acidimicrobiales bacterium]
MAQAAATQPNAADDEHFAQVREYFDDGQIVELVATIALFGYLNRWNDTMATELEELPLSVARRHLGAQGWEAGKHSPSGWT